MTAAGFNGTRALQTSNRSWSRIRQWGNWEPRDYWLGRQTGEQKILTEYKMVESVDDTWYMYS